MQLPRETQGRIVADNDLALCVDLAGGKSIEAIELGRCDRKHSGK